MLELQITEVKEAQPYKVINFDALKAEISKQLGKYANIIYDDEGFTAAEKDRANINKFIGVLDDKRKLIKKACLTNYAEFEKQINELKSLAEKPLAEISKQINEIETKRKSEKTRQITVEFLKAFEGIKGVATFDKIFNDRWLNRTYTMKKVTDELQAKASVVKQDLQALSEVTKSDEIKRQALLVYSKDLCLSSALVEAKRLTEQAARMEAERKAAEEARIAQEAAEHKAQENMFAEAQRKIDEEKKAAAAAEIINVQPDIEPGTKKQESAPEEIKRIDFSVWVTHAQALALRQYLIDNKIKYGKVR